MPAGEDLLRQRSLNAEKTRRPAWDGDFLRQVFDILLVAYGPQHWWPGDTPFEIAIGAILTQNTAWSNVERAISTLKAGGYLESVQAMRVLSARDLAPLIRPAGYFNLKAKRLLAFGHWLEQADGLPGLGNIPTPKLRQQLLGINGIGPETADDILLYALDRPVFVVDAYTRRLFERLGCLTGGEDYETIRQGFESALPPDPMFYNEYHALIVRHAKAVCHKRQPGCPRCPLAARCDAQH
ncbi:putative DNA repair glycosylase MJ1434 [Gammaproteobacteria bacterium]